MLKELKQLPIDLEIIKTSNFDPEPKTVGELYKTMRANVIEVVFREWKRTGLFWEQYHDRKGVGCCN
jgi:mannosyl-oligosaccharide glucosidase